MNKENLELKNKTGIGDNNSVSKPRDEKEVSENNSEQKKAENAGRKRKQKAGIVVAGCCAAVLAVVAVASSGGGNKGKKVIPVAAESSAETPEVPSVSILSENFKENEMRQSSESTKEQTDNESTIDDKKDGRKAAGISEDPNEEGIKDSDTSKQQENADHPKPEKQQEASISHGQQTPPATMPDAESAQETEEKRQPITPVTETPVPEVPVQEEVYLQAEPVVTTAPHTHTWQEKVRTIHHAAVTENVKVVDQAAYSEPVFEEMPVYETIVVNVCDVCGEDIESVGDHMETHIDWETFTNPFHYHVEFRQGDLIGTELLQTGTITHPEISHMETKVVKAAYDEQVPDGYVCTGCGAVK